MSRNKIKRDPPPVPRRKRRRWLWAFGIATLVLLGWQVFGWVTNVPTPIAVASNVSDKLYDEVYGEEIARRADSLPAEVNILVVGLDNRVASNDNHADAIHLVTIRTKDSVGATITSIPRGTPVTGYGIEDDLSFMANLRALRGRKTFTKAVAKLTGKRKIDYYIEVTFSQVMGVLELLGYKDPATALQFLRHRKSFPLGDVQRSHNQGEFIRRQLIRRGEMLNGASGDLLIRMGLGMVNTDLDLETSQALFYVLHHADALDTSHIHLDMRPRMYLKALQDIDIPEPDAMNSAVDKLVHRLGNQIDDLGRYDPYPQMRSIVDRAGRLQKPKAVVHALEPVFEQKAWLQVQERPRRRDIRDRVEQLLVKAYTDLKQPDKATAVRDYMAHERKAFSEVETQTRTFTYGRRIVPHHTTAIDSAALRQAQQDDIPQDQTPLEEQTPEEETLPIQPTLQDTPKVTLPRVDKPVEPKVMNIDTSGKGGE